MFNFMSWKLQGLAVCNLKNAEIGFSLKPVMGRQDWQAWPTRAHGRHRRAAGTALYVNLELVRM